MVHIIGDVHQPLHSCALFNSTFPNGDQGGNLIQITFEGQPGINNLHKVWDSIFMKVLNRIDLPLNEEGQKYIEDIASNIMEEHPKDKFGPIINSKFKDWLMESWKVCKDFVYHDLKGKVIQNDYIDKGYIIARERIALAGYRISNILKLSYERYLKQKSEIEKTKFLGLVN